MIFRVGRNRDGLEQQITPSLLFFLDLWESVIYNVSVSFSETIKKM